MRMQCSCIVKPLTFDWSTHLSPFWGRCEKVNNRYPSYTSTLYAHFKFIIIEKQNVTLFSILFLVDKNLNT